METKETNMEEMQAHFGRASKEIQDSVLAGYKTIANNISSAHFKPIQDTIETETGKKVEFEKAVNIFKTKLYARIESKFLNNWKDMDLDTSIAHLEFSKAQTKDEEKKWRPTKESVDEQIRPAIVKELTKRKNLLQRQMDYQNGVIEELIPQVEQHRRQMRDLAEKRQQIVARIDHDNVSLKKVDDQIAMIHDVLNSKSIPMD